MRPFLIDEEVRLKIAGLVAQAEQNIFTLEDMKAIMRGEAQAAGTLYGLKIDLPFGYVVAYSIEQHPLKDGSGVADMRHLSVSVDRAGNLPAIKVVEEIMKLIGFTSELTECRVWLEDFDAGHQAVNVLEAIKPKNNE